MIPSAVEEMYDEQVDALADVLTDLDPGQWEHPSLCARWRVRDVVAHLVSTYQAAPPPAVGRLLLRSGWSCSWVLDRQARKAARDEPSQLLARFTQIDRSAGVARFVGRDQLLADHVVHTLDVCIPLQRPAPVPAERLTATLDALLTHRGFGLSAGALASGLRLTATDLEWSAGGGPEVRGPAQAFVLALTGRPLGLQQLHGDGVPLLRERVA